MFIRKQVEIQVSGIKNLKIVDEMIEIYYSRWHVINKTLKDSVVGLFKKGP